MQKCYSGGGASLAVSVDSGNYRCCVIVSPLASYGIRKLRENGIGRAYVHGPHTRARKGARLPTLAMAWQKGTGEIVSQTRPSREERGSGEVIGTGWV